MTRPLRFTFDDACHAFDEWAANCGPVALAAMTGLTLDEVRPHLGDFETKGYTNPTLMWSALKSIGVPFEKVGPNLPKYGLLRVQWMGPWMKPNVPRRARYRYTHWVGTTVDRTGGRGIFDVNAMNNGTGWTSFADWQGVLAPHLWAGYKHADGWIIADGAGDSLELAYVIQGDPRP